MDKFYGEFNSAEDVKSEFKVSAEDFEGVEILFASYRYEDYDGSAFVLFQRDGQLYEVNGGHCSCYGLEDQWEPEETSVEALKLRLKDGWSLKYHNEDGSLSELLDTLDS